MSYSIIAAVGKNGELGINSRIPWKIPEDLIRFRDLTSQHTIIMGRKTFDSIGRALPNRKNIVITRDPEFSAPTCTVVTSIDDALLATRDEAETFIIGGAEIFEAALPFVDKMYLTEIDAEFEADTFFPKIDLSTWQIKEATSGKSKEGQPYKFSYITYERRKN